MILQHDNNKALSETDIILQSPTPLSPFLKPNFFTEVILLVIQFLGPLPPHPLRSGVHLHYLTEAPLSRCCRHPYGLIQWTLFRIHLSSEPLTLLTMPSLWEHALHFASKTPHSWFLSTLLRISSKSPLRALL